MYLTIGIFDGVHLGHQKVISQLVKEADARGRESVLLTFDPHPLKIVAPQRPLYLLTSLEEKRRIVSELGIKRMVVLPFSREMAQLSGEDFIKEVLLPLGPKKIFIGENYLFGHQREGDIRLLREMGTKHNFQIEAIVPLKIKDKVVSSTSIRDHLLRGEIPEVRELLGRLPSRWGQVITGCGRGKTIGYPTANLDWDKTLILPKAGVYAVYVKIGGERFSGMANIGHRPTFKEKELTFEVHLFDFKEDIYNQQIEVTFVERMREERAFENESSLKAQLIQDEAMARKILVAKEEEI